jgi:hypothetical protein
MPAQCRTSIRPTVTISWPSGPQRRPAERLLGPGRLAQPTMEKGGHAGTCQPGAAGTSGGAAARQRWRCRVSGTRTEGDPSARQMWRGGWTLTEVACRRGGGSVAKERRCSGYGGTPAGGGDLRVVLRHGEAKAKMRRGFQGEAMARGRSSP